ncbi:uncharacterized protein LOC124259405 [Haliotis rubra]|uniref:uncharacterized protein LOC124259405 n=1 Tax=Haliotis rubra TaxID=36100 RepID=UPI001EE59A09|nr:uncharacterized protein LOC124259405 [Haliotis rubra]
MGSNFLTLVSICVILKMNGDYAEAMTRQLVARAIPLKDIKLNSAPLKTLITRSRIACLKECIRTAGCQALNFGKTDKCELLGTYLCARTASLIPSTDFAYYDVEFEDTLSSIGIHDSKTSCKTGGKCSPKCECEWTADFDVYPGKYVVGFTMETVNSVTQTECQQRCVDATTFQCKSADYSFSSTCYLSHVNRIDVPEAFSAQNGYTYLHRKCQ